MAIIHGSARRYAEALFSIARPNQAYDVWLRDLERLDAILQDENAHQVLTSPAVPEEERQAALEKLLPDARPEFRNLIRLLLQRNRLKLVPEILAAFREQVDEERGIVTAEVTSAMPLDEGLRSVVAERLARFSGKQVRLELSVDPQLIGGIVARIGDELIDDSVRGRLQRLRHQLAQAGS